MYNIALNKLNALEKEYINTGLKEILEGFRPERFEREAFSGRIVKGDNDVGIETKEWKEHQTIINTRLKLWFDNADSLYAFINDNLSGEEGLKLTNLSIRKSLPFNNKNMPNFKLFWTRNINLINNYTKTGE